MDKVFKIYASGCNCESYPPTADYPSALLAFPVPIKQHPRPGELFTPRKIAKRYTRQRKILVVFTEAVG